MTLHLSIARPVDCAAGRIIRAIRLNTLLETRLFDRPIIIKTRNPFGRHAIGLANLFFRACGVPLRFWHDTASWQEAEVTAFRALNPSYDAQRFGPDAIVEDRLPGESLWIHLKRGTLTRQMLIAAANEFRRAHALISDVYGGPWSHGDAAMCNLLFDEMTQCARFIDFEIRHIPELSAVERHADDLLAFLLDLVSLAPERRWLPWATTFLETYGNAAVVAELERRLEAPRGPGRFWWKIRANFAQTRLITRRFAALRAALHRHGQRPIDADATSVCLLPTARPLPRGFQMPVRARGE